MRGKIFCLTFGHALVCFLSDGGCRQRITCLIPLPLRGGNVLFVESEGRRDPRILKTLNLVIVRPDTPWRGGRSLVADACERNQQRIRRHPEHEACIGQWGEVRIQYPIPPFQRLLPVQVPAFSLPIP
jgi:hypothetical protein